MRGQITFLVLVFAYMQRKRTNMSTRGFEKCNLIIFFIMRSVGSSPGELAVDDILFRYVIRLGVLQEANVWFVYHWLVLGHRNTLCDPKFIPLESKRHNISNLQSELCVISPCDESKSCFCTERLIYNQTLSCPSHMVSHVMHGRSRQIDKLYVTFRPILLPLVNLWLYLTHG